MKKILLIAFILWGQGAFATAMPLMDDAELGRFKSKVVAVLADPNINLNTGTYMASLTPAQDAYVNSQRGTLTAGMSDDQIKAWVEFHRKNLTTQVIPGGMPKGGVQGSVQSDGRWATINNMRAEIRNCKQRIKSNRKQIRDLLKGLRKEGKCDKNTATAIIKEAIDTSDLTIDQIAAVADMS